MKITKDLNWLSAPAFLLILGMILLNAKKLPRNNGQQAEIRSAGTAFSISK